MLDQYKRQMMPSTNRDEDLRHMVESYEMKLRKAEYAISEEARLTEELCQRQNEYQLEKRRIANSAGLHADTIKRGEALLADIERDTTHQLIEMSKEKVRLDNANIDLTYLQDELVNYKERQRKQAEEDRRRQLA